MKNKVRILLYLGDDELFFEELVKFYPDRQQYEVEKQSLLNDSAWVQKFFDKYLDRYPHVIFVDFLKLRGPENKEILDNLLQLMRLFRRHYMYQVVPFIGLFSSREDLADFSYLFSCGLSYAYIKKEKIDRTIFRDANYFAFEDNTMFPEYATASNIGLPYKISMSGSIYSINAESLVVESDYNFESGEKVELKLNLFEDFILEAMEVSDVFSDSCYYDYINRALLTINYPTPWETLAENSFMRDTMETWLDSYNNNFVDKNINILLINQRSNVFRKAFHETQKSGFVIHQKNFLQNAYDTVRATKPALIIFTMDPPHEEGLNVGGFSNDTSALFEIIQAIKRMEINPQIIVFSSVSGSEALKKAYNYTNILAHPGDLDIDLISKLLEIYKARSQKANVKWSDKIFDVADDKRIFEIKTEVTVTSLTEHEMTFLSAAEFPYYCVLKIDVPVSCYLTIVPPTRKLNDTGGKTHYMGFLNGVTEDDLKVLRRFVNKIIFQPLTEYVNEMEEEESKKIVMEEQPQVVEVIGQKRQSAGPPERDEVGRKNMSGKKSKL